MLVLFRTLKNGIYLILLSNSPHSTTLFLWNVWKHFLFQNYYLKILLIVLASVSCLKDYCYSSTLCILNTTIFQSIVQIPIHWVTLPVFILLKKSFLEEVEEEWEGRGSRKELQSPFPMSLSHSEQGRHRGVRNEGVKLMLEWNRGRVVLVLSILTIWNRVKRLKKVKSVLPVTVIGKQSFCLYPML